MAPQNGHHRRFGECLLSGSELVCTFSLILMEVQLPAYYIGEHIVSDFTLFDAYLAKVVPMIEHFGGRYLTKAGSHEILEGDWKPNRVVIIEFPDMASIKNWYRAPEYQPLIALRRSAAIDVMIMLSLAHRGVVPHIIIRSSRLRLGEFESPATKGLLQH
jgi:uncharacterized protein (DUF1330 family)